MAGGTAAGRGGPWETAATSGSAFADPNAGVTSGGPGSSDVTYAKSIVGAELAAAVNNAKNKADIAAEVSCCQLPISWRHWDNLPLSD